MIHSFGLILSNGVKRAQIISLMLRRMEIKKKTRKSAIRSGLQHLNYNR